MRAHLHRFPATAILTVLLLAISACGGSNAAEVESLGDSGAPPAKYRVRVIAEHPHDTDAFTQGLVWAREGELYESTGQRGASTLRLIRIDTGETRRVHELDAEYFGEGLALVDDQLIQLTWQEQTAFVYEKDSFDEVGTFEYRGEGWGLCFDGNRLIMSDGSSTLTFRDPSTFEAVGRIRVTNQSAPLSSLNELECVGERVYANVLSDDHIYEIDPGSGEVTADIDASALQPDADRARGEVLNGIAYASDSGRFYLTGKDWPTLYEVTFEPV